MLNNITITWKFTNKRSGFCYLLLDNKTERDWDRVIKNNASCVDKINYPNNLTASWEQKYKNTLDT